MSAIDDQQGLPFSLLGERGHRIIHGWLLSFLGWFAGCSTNSTQYLECEPQWGSAPVKLDVSAYGHLPPQVEFSQDSRFVLTAWGWPGPRGDGKSTTRVVFSVDGHCAFDSSDPAKWAASDYSRSFPWLAPRTSARILPSTFGDVCQWLPASDLLKSVGGWGFSSDFRMVLRLANPRSAYDGHTMDVEENGPAIWTAELWETMPQKRLWSADLPSTLFRLLDVGFFREDGRECVLVAFGGDHGFVLSKDDGRLLYEIPYRRAVGTREVGPSKRKVEAVLPKVDPGASFSACTGAFESSAMLFACGASVGRRIRVLSVNPPGVTVFEANTADNPTEPVGGWWSVKDVRFAAKGRYLIVQYHFAGRGTTKAFSPIDVFETEKWCKVWHANSNSIASISVSDDGKQLAVARYGGMLRRSGVEVGRFVVNADAAGKD